MKTQWLGVFPKDKVPKEVDRYPTCMVVNTDPANRPGQHWVAYYFCSATKYEFFDSYGLHPSAYDFEERLLFPFDYNPYLLQSPYSECCGQYCIYYLYERGRNIQFYDLLSSFHRLDYYFNDKLVTRFYNYHFNPRDYYYHIFSSPSTSDQISLSLSHNQDSNIRLFVSKNFNK